jgi:hypothetical protein
MFRQIVTNFAEEYASEFRVEESTKIRNYGFLRNVGITVPNYMASHLRIMLPSIDAAKIV